LIALFFAGVGNSVQHPLSSTIISHTFPGDDRRGALGTYNFFGDVGKFAFGGIVSLLLVAGISWEAPVIGFGLCGMLTAFAIWALVTDTGAGRPAPASGQTQTAAKAAGWGIRDRRGFTA